MANGRGEVKTVTDLIFLGSKITVNSDFSHEIKRHLLFGRKAMTNLDNTLKRRDAKGKGEKERYTHLNAEFQRITRRDKKAFPSDQRKEKEENNRMGKTRDLFKKIRDTKGTFHAKMGTIKDRDGMAQQKQNMLRRGGENTQKNYTKKIFMIQITMIL